LQLSDINDLQIKSGNSEYRHASLIDLYLHSKFRWKWKTLRPVLFGWLGVIDLKITHYVLKTVPKQQLWGILSKNSTLVLKYNLI